VTKLLLIADDVTYLSTLTSRLINNGYQVVSCTRGQDGFEEASQERPDLIILDVGMSHLDGVQACRRFRALTTTPIILVTTRTDEAALIQGLEAGADAYVVKSCSQRLLLAKIAALSLCLSQNGLGNWLSVLSGQVMFVV
jgi:two-component system KDP operon response regulator KdpE